MIEFQSTDLDGARATVYCRWESVSHFVEFADKAKGIAGAVYVNGVPFWVETDEFARLLRFIDGECMKDHK